MSSPTTWLIDDLDELESQGLHRSRRQFLSAQGPRIRSHGRKLVNFSSNDYLNLAGDPRLAAAAARAARRYGCGAGASPLVSGHLPPHRRLEKALANFEGEEAALLFSSGFVANLAVISSLVSEQDAIFSDRLNHASLIDGCRLSRATVHIYDHADAEHLEELLKQHAAQARRRLIVTESAFSMDGDVAPLPRLAALAARYEATLLIDEAHATGVLGPNGRGLSPRLGSVTSNCLIIKMGTLSKAFGAQGGFVSGPQLLIDWLINRARPYIFSTAPAPPICAAARRALQIADAELERRQTVLALAVRLRRLLTENDFDTRSSACQIVPIVVGNPARALQLSAKLEERGFIVPAIRPPSVPAGTSRLRISVTAGHNEEDIDRLVQALIGCCSSHQPEALARRSSVGSPR